MKKNGKYIIWCGIIAMWALGCKKPYTPNVISSNNNYLVVEGVINTGGDSTVIRLSRTVNLSSGVTINPELNATVIIQSDQNQTYSLHSIGNGQYASTPLTLDNTRKYRLSIGTSDGKAFLSDYVPAIATPPIDSVGFTILNNGVQIYVNTHDPNNNTHYYRWDYNETWIFHAKYDSEYISNDSTDVVPRSPDKQIYQCWGSGISTVITLGSSAKLSQDVIYQSPIIFIPSTSEKIESRYSILLKQYAMTSDGYNYYTILKKNTEQLGSIFDAQPSQLTGNIHCTTDATLPVIGYISAGTVQQKRVYINNSQLPTWQPTYPYTCGLDTAFYASKGPNPVNQVLQNLVPQPNSNITIYAVFGNGPNPIGYTYSDPDCADCSIRGSLTKPSFWQ
ncbi:DUF4249 domain-containing protein [Mucilaginibacter sp. X5P1]|uniref:DUF4249 domain-containing protein n=1 Tax=Mucilaginibacter sp. X5P1 TaxID=2723088 RepID=UPI0016182982|nr:DUF4249 domain-containing protein [Mucilaginibacter sp. X5P1]MBB6137819.1 hypothetical protein [Mucilaginibacter sp. X5P1]